MKNKYLKVYEVVFNGDEKIKITLSKTPLCGEKFITTKTKSKDEN
jgi:hypothetical protein